MSRVDEAFIAAASLDTPEKLQLISRLWESVPPADYRPSDAARAEMDRRWAEYEADEVKAIPWEQVRNEVRRRLASDD